MNQLQSQEVEFMADIMIGIILIAAVGAVIWKKRRDKKNGEIRLRRLLRQLRAEVPSKKRRWE